MGQNFERGTLRGQHHLEEKLYEVNSTGAVFYGGRTVGGGPMGTKT